MVDVIYAAFLRPANRFTSSSAIRATRKPRASSSTGASGELDDGAAFGGGVVIGELMSDAGRTRHRHAAVGKLGRIGGFPPCPPAHTRVAPRLP